MRMTAFLFIILAAGCTTLGADDHRARNQIDYGPKANIRLCVLRDQSLGNDQVFSLIKAIGAEMAPFGIMVEVPWIKPWERQGFDYNQIINAIIMAHPLTAECDRIAGFVGRNAGDIMWGAMLMPEVLGAVETITRTRGFIIAEVGSLNQILSPPSSTAAHEFFHMLGCDHDLSMNDCYHRIAELKAQTRMFRAKGIDMVPGLLPNGEFIASRQHIDDLLQQSMKRGMRPS